MKNFKKIFLLINFWNFWLVANSENSFAEFKLSKDLETTSDYTQTFENIERSYKPINKAQKKIYYKNIYQDPVISEQNDYYNTTPFDENFIQSQEVDKIYNKNDFRNFTATPSTQIQQKNFNQKIIKKQKIVKYLNSKNSLTIGNYFGIDYLNASLKFREMDNNNEVIPYNSPDLKNGFGLKYFYAINFNNFFMAPEIFYEKIGVRNKYSYNRFSTHEENGKYYDKRFAFGYKFMEIHQRYGGKINIGYDFNSNFSPYFFGGLSYIDFSNLISPYTINQRNTALQKNGYDVFQIKKGRKLVPFYGYGLKIKLTNRFYLNAEYHIVDFMVNTKAHKYSKIDVNESQANSNFIDLDNSLRIFKAGLLYNF